jgi:O-antigen/teichoic acid export membrane protein
VLLVTDNLALALGGVICSIIMTRLWPARDVGTVASISGAMNILVVGSTLGLQTTIVRFLGREERQRRLMRQTMLVTGAIASLAAAVVALVPGHLGVPLDDLALRPILLTALLVGYALASIVVTVGDPAYIARQEVSFMLGKDLFASLVRIVLILAVSHTSSRSLFLAVFGYTAVAGAVDLLILSSRLKDREPRPGSPQGVLQPLRSRFSFAAAIYISLIVTSGPIYLLPVFTAALSGAANAAYIAIALQVAAVLTLVPSQTGQSLLSDLSQRPDKLAQSTLRALRGAYLVTLPVAVFIGVLAPYVLLVFGSRYSQHGTGFLRWTAASSVFFIFNYVADVVLLARHRVRAYVVANVSGSAIQVTLVVLALTTNFSLLGPAWFLGQAAYATISGAILLRYVNSEQRRAIRDELAVMTRRIRH